MLGSREFMLFVACYCRIASTLFSQASHSETCLRINPHGSVKLKLEPDSLRKHQVKAVKVNARLLDVD